MPSSRRRSGCSAGTSTMQDAHPVWVGDPHLQQPPRLPLRLPQDPHATLTELPSHPGQLAHLQPQRHARGPGGAAARPDSSRNPPPRKKTVPRSGPLPNSR